VLFEHHPSFSARSPPPPPAAARRIEGIMTMPHAAAMDMEYAMANNDDDGNDHLARW
jgi:hypothetical protein